MSLDGEYGAWSGPLKPSTEWRFHLDIMRARPDVGAIVHFHPIYGTALAMLQKPIPAVHHMIAMFGGSIVKCTKYAPFGTKELADLVVEGLGDRHAVLLGNHGALTTGADLPDRDEPRARTRESRAHVLSSRLPPGGRRFFPKTRRCAPSSASRPMAPRAESQKPAAATPKKRSRGKTKAARQAKKPASRARRRRAPTERPAFGDERAFRAGQAAAASP